MLEHTRRLADSGKILGFPLPYSEEQLNQATIEVIRANKLKECYIRPLAFVGLGELGLYAPNNPVSVCIAVWPWGAYLGAEGLTNGIRAKVSSFTRHHVNVMMTKSKGAGNYINSVLAKHEVKKAGYDEAIMLVPPMASIGMPLSLKARITPICAKARAPPPLKTKLTAEAVKRRASFLKSAGAVKTV